MIPLKQPAFYPADYVADQAKKPVQRIVVFLHGLGASGDDLLPIGQQWAQALPGTLFISPHAPQPCDMAPGYPHSYQWFSLLDRAPAALLAGAAAAAPLLNDFLDRLLDAHHLTAQQMALVGFSQGSMMALYTAPRRAQKLAGILAYSGALIGGEDLANAPSKPPVLLVHGMQDMVVPFMAMQHAEALLSQAGFKVRGMARAGLDHGIDPEGMKAGLQFLRESFGL